MKVRSILVAVFIISAPILLFSHQASSIENKLVIVSPISGRSITPVADAFKGFIFKKYGTNITVDHIAGGSPELLSRVLAWGGRPDADVFWGGEYQYYSLLAAKGLLEPYKGANAGQVPEFFKDFRLKDAAGNWIAISFYSPGIMTNKDALKRINAPEPKTWDDLLKPIYKDQIIMTTPSKSGGLHIDVELILQSRGTEKGWAYFRKLATNVGSWVGRSLEVSSAVQKGEYALGIAIAETSAVIAIKAGAPVGFIYPDPSALVPSPIGILKGAKNLGLAKEFMDFVLAKDAQVDFLKGGLVPARQDILYSAYPQIAEAGILRQVIGADNIYGVPAGIYNLNFTLSEVRNADVNKFFEETITQKLDLLKSSWTSINDASQAIKNAQGRIPYLESQGYDTSKVRSALQDAQNGVDSALTAFGKGDYSNALSTANGAKSKADASVGLAEQIPFYVRYAWVIGLAAAIIVAGLAVFYVRRR